MLCQVWDERLRTEEDSGWKIFVEVLAAVSLEKVFRFSVCEQAMKQRCSSVR